MIIGRVRNMPPHTATPDHLYMIHVAEVSDNSRGVYRGGVKGQQILWKKYLNRGKFCGKCVPCREFICTFCLTFFLSPSPFCIFCIYIEDER